MRIIDRYLLRQFVGVFLICFISLTGLYVVIDAFGNLDEFISHTKESGDGLMQVMGQYYGYRSLAFFDRVSGVLALISAMFTVTWIQRHQEMTALSSAGIATSRIVLPIILAAGSISLLALANRELVIPKIRNYLSFNAQRLDNEKGQEIRPLYDHENEILLRGASAIVQTKTIREPNFLLPRGLDRYGKHLVGRVAVYELASGDRPAGYRFHGVEQPASLLENPSLTLAGQRVVLSSFDTPWLKADECFVVSNVNFEILVGGQTFRNYSSTAELIRGLKSPSLDLGADVRVAIHGRIVQPMLDVTLLFLGLPLAVAQQNRNVFRAIGLCVLIAITFMLVVIFCQYLGGAYWINPALAAWLPLMIFVPVAIAMAEPLRR
jgi:lipopolysaccharide export system permease protein